MSRGPSVLPFRGFSLKEIRSSLKKIYGVCARSTITLGLIWNMNRDERSFGMGCEASPSLSYQERSP